MPTRIPRHEWVIAPFRADRDANYDPGVPCYYIDAHRNLGGPYSAASELVRRLVPQASVFAPDLAVTHQLTLLIISPGLENYIPVSREVAKLLTYSREGDPRSWTHRLAHGLTDFLLSYAARVSPSGLSISFENVDLADPLDREFIAVLLRRANPERLTLRVCSSSDHLDDPLLTALKTHASTNYLEPLALDCIPPIPEVWRTWLRQSAAGWAGEWIALSDLSKYVDLSAIRPPSCSLQRSLSNFVERIPPAERHRLASDYVESDCTSDRLLTRHAYASLPMADRKVLHRARAMALEGLNQGSASLGAIALHHEQAGAEATRLLAASKHCMRLAFYDATLDWAVRGRRMLAAEDRGETYGDFARNILFSLLLLGRFDEVEALCAENLASSEDPALLARTSYAKAILNARLYDPSRRDYQAARTWVEKALAFEERLASSEIKAVNMAFLRNTLALVEMRTGRPEVAHELLSAALDYMAQEVPEGYEVERALLLHNRARLHIVRQQIAEAIDDLTTLLRFQPSDSSAYFDRGVLYQRSGRFEDALRDYDAAIRWSPPYPEPYLNRAQTLASLRRPDEALVDYAYVLTLVPDHIEALLHRALLFFDQGKFDASRADVDTALQLSPAHARLLCLRGLLEMKDGNLDRANQTFTKSIDADPSLPDAWANRATVRFKQGDMDGSFLDLTQALSLREEAATFYNRGRVCEAQRRWAEAVEDYSRALELESGDVQYILRHRSLCRQAGGLA